MAVPPSEKGSVVVVGFFFFFGLTLKYVKYTVNLKTVAVVVSCDVVWYR